MINESVVCGGDIYTLRSTYKKL